jgi:transketolase
MSYITDQKKIRQKILELTYKTNSAHVASNLSIVDILLVIYKNFVRKKNKNEFILSKGHACLSYYVILNFFGYISDKKLNTFGKNNTELMSHISHKVPGVVFSTGSLGHGLPFSVGKAFINKQKKIYCLISDGEINEGSNWEAFMFVSHHKLSNLKIIIDCNKIQSLDYVKNVIDLEPLEDKFKSFGYHVSRIDGHNHNKLKNTLNIKTKKPHIIIADTIKGKGVKFMQNSVLWHYKPPNKMQLDEAIKKL